MVYTGHCDPPGGKFVRGRFGTPPIDSGCCSPQNSGFNLLLLLLPFAQCCLSYPTARTTTTNKRKSPAALQWITIFPSFFFPSLHPRTLDYHRLTNPHTRNSRLTGDGEKKTLAKKQEAHFAFGNRFSSPHHTPLGMFYAVALTLHALITPQRTPARTVPQVFALQTAKIQPQNREIFQSSQSLRKNALLLRPIRWTDLTRV